MSYVIGCASKKYVATYLPDDEEDKAISLFRELTDKGEKYVYLEFYENIKTASHDTPA